MTGKESRRLSGVSSRQGLTGPQVAVVGDIGVGDTTVYVPPGGNWRKLQICGASVKAKALSLSVAA